MFTGIIEDIGRVVKVARGSESARLSINCRLGREGLAQGASLAVDGACLTLCSQQGDELSFDISAETLSRTTLGRLAAGEEVHLERALSLGGRLEGHLVTGHVDGVGRLVGRKEKGGGLELEIEAPENVAHYLVDKGSVAVCGVSLTVIQPGGARFRVALVPQTLQRTYLGRLAPGSEVNLEADIIGKYVRKFLEKDSSTIDEDFLRRHGFW
jgi:riboflavin synthase